MVIERFTGGVEFELGALEGQAFAGESEVFICDADILRFVLLRFVFGDPAAEFLKVWMSTGEVASSKAL